MAGIRNNPQRIDEQFAMTQTVAGVATKYWPLTDALGSVYAWMDRSGNLRDTYSYDVYGARTQLTGTDNIAWGFTGREHDPGTGLIYSRHRYLNPSLGTWMQPDPLFPIDPILGMPTGELQVAENNLYAYTGADPTGATDPMGLLVILKGNILNACQLVPGSTNPLDIAGGRSQAVSDARLVHIEQLLFSFASSPQCNLFFSGQFPNGPSMSSLLWDPGLWVQYGPTALYLETSPITGSLGVYSPNAEAVGANTINVQCALFVTGGATDAGVAQILLHELTHIAQIRSAGVTWASWIQDIVGGATYGAQVLNNPFSHDLRPWEQQAEQVAQVCGAH